MICLILVTCGVILLIYSIVLCHRLNKKIDKNVAEKPGSLVLILIYFFLLGYVTFLGRLIFTITSHGIFEYLVSIIFFFGALFVAIVLKVNHKLILNLTTNSINLGKLNKELENKNKKLRQKTDALKTSEEKYKKRSKELEQTLDDFYTMRLSMEEQVRKGVLEAENKKIKERLDKVKSDN